MTLLSQSSKASSSSTAITEPDTDVQISALLAYAEDFLQGRGIAEAEYRALRDAVEAGEPCGHCGLCYPQKTLREHIPECTSNKGKGRAD